VDLSAVESEEMVARYDIKMGTKLLTYDFVLASEEEARMWREEEARSAMSKLGSKVIFIDGLPVPDVD